MHRDGSMDSDPPPEALDALIRELDGPDDPEHPDVAVSHETEWSLSAFPSGLVVWQNLDAAAKERRVDGVTREELRALFDAVSRGDLEAVEASLDEITRRQHR